MATTQLKVMTHVCEQGKSGGGQRLHDFEFLNNITEIDIFGTPKISYINFCH